MSSVDEIPSINPSAYVFIFGNFNVHYKDWLTYSGGTDRPGQLSYNFATQIPDCDSDNPALLDLFLSSDTSICSTMAFPPLENSDHVIVSVSIEFLSKSIGDTSFYYKAYDYPCADSYGLCNHLRDVLWEDIFKLGASATAS